MKNIYFLFVIGLMILGCSSTIELRSADEIGTKIGKKSAVVHLRSGQEYYGRDVQSGKDSVRLIDDDSGDTLQFVNREIKSIVKTDHLYGAVKGFLYAAVITGSLVFATMSAGHSDEEYTNRNARNIVSLIAAGGGGVIGITFGGLLGHRYTYIFPKDSVKAATGSSADSTNQ